MIQLQNIECLFRKGSDSEVTALKSVNATIFSGDYITIVGANGSGKSTLLNVLAGNIFPTSGKVILEGKDITHLPAYRRAPYIARVFQDPLKGTVPDLSILENFRLAALRSGRKKLRWGITSDFRNVVQRELSRLNLGLENHSNRLMGSLSGGQRQALTLLMAVMSPCKLLLMDEPTSALDPRTSEMVMRIADSLIKQHDLTAIQITHRMKDAVNFGNRLLMMKDGKITRDIQSEEKKKILPAELLEWFS